MSSFSSLLVDIGGTNMRYAYANKKSISEEKILSNISDQKINKTLGNLLSNPQIKNAVIAAAGPRLGNRIEMTNRKVVVDGDLLGRKFKLANSQVLNDWEAVGYAIDEMKLKKIIPFIYLFIGTLALPQPSLGKEKIEVTPLIQTSEGLSGKNFNYLDGKPESVSYTHLTLPTKA